MSGDLNLPEFKIPRLRQKKLTLEEYDRIIYENYRMLPLSDRLKDLLDSPRRRPVDKRFTFNGD